MIKKNFNNGWEFGPATNAVMSGWTHVAQQKFEMISLPHDAMILSGRRADSPTGPGGAFFHADDYEYLKTFLVPEQDSGKIIWLEFEGVYVNAAIWINDEYVGKAPFGNGYSDFCIRISDYLKFGTENTVRVTVKNTAQPNSRWYSGTGIYRNVKIIMADLLHIKLDGLRIRSPEIEEQLAVVEVATEIEHEGAGRKSGYVITEIKTSAGKFAVSEKTKFTVFSGESLIVRQRMYVHNPDLWSIDTPNLYTCNVRITEDETIIDEDNAVFGIRKLQLDTVHGFRINGEIVKLKGGCVHHDNGMLGAATFEDAEERRVRMLKEAGYNALRSSHQPMSKAMLDACDRLGMIVLDELTDMWNKQKNRYDQGYFFEEWMETGVESMVAKDYNHPCVCFYSIGNEVAESGAEFGAHWGRKIAEKIRSLDENRYITNCMNLLIFIMNRIPDVIAAAMEESGVEGKDINEIMSKLPTKKREELTNRFVSPMIEETCGTLDVVGYNYTPERYELERNKTPNRIYLGTESSPRVLDICWEPVERLPYVIGDFGWTAWDYLGEVGVGRVQYQNEGVSSKGGFYAGYPWIVAHCGDLDISGYRRPISYWHETVWGGRNHVPYIAVQKPERYGHKATYSKWSWTDSIHSWTWPGFEDNSIISEVYSDAEEIELFVNGQSIGRKAVGSTERKCYASWDTIYTPGELTAVAYIGGMEVGRSILKTASEAKIVLYPEKQFLRVGTNDLCFIPIELRDSDGTLNMAVKKTLTVTVKGPAVLQACGSTDPKITESFGANTHETFEGRMLVIMRAGTEKGIVKITVSSECGECIFTEIEVV